MLLESVLSRRHSFPDDRILWFLGRNFLSSLKKLDEYSALLKILTRKIKGKIFLTSAMFIVFCWVYFQHSREISRALLTISRAFKVFCKSETQFFMDRILPLGCKIFSYPGRGIDSFPRSLSYATSAPPAK